MFSFIFILLPYVQLFLDLIKQDEPAVPPDSFDKLFKIRYLPEELQKITSQCFDVIVIGSGAGGGTVATDLLQNEKQKILVLEKGGVTLTTHSLNTARPFSKRKLEHSPTSHTTTFNEPTQDNDMLFRIFRTNQKVTTDSACYDGGPVYTLGGRSTLWGNFTPRIPYQILKHHFGIKIANHLYNEYYTKVGVIGII